MAVNLALSFPVSLRSTFPPSPKIGRGNLMLPLFVFLPPLPSLNYGQEKRW